MDRKHSTSFGVPDFQEISSRCAPWGRALGTQYTTVVYSTVLVRDHGVERVRSTTPCYDHSTASQVGRGQCSGPVASH